MTVLFSWIYDVFIVPLAIAYGAAYYACSRLLGHGYGLLALSVLTTLLLSPLRKRVAKGQREERLLRAVMEPQLARIKAESSGEERHRRLRRLYRRYSYHPAMSIRATWGLLLQVPFILAAYHMLAESTALRLVSFWGIPSLAQADALLPGGVNLLPPLMTLFNLAAAALTPGATRRETLQAVLLALLFLALLYDAPSALLVYWTANNLLSLAAVLRQRLLPEKRPDDEDEAGSIPAASGASAAAPADGSPVHAALYAFACVSLPVLWWFLLERQAETALSGASPFFFTFALPELLLAGGLSVAAVAGARRIAARRKTGRPAGFWSAARVLFCSGLAAFIVAGWALSLRGRSVSGKIFIWTTLAAVGAAALAWFTAAGGLTAAFGRLVRRAAEHSGRPLYWPAALALAALVSLFAPLAAFQTAPEMFNLAPGEVLRGLLPYFLCLVYIFLYIRIVLPPRAGSLFGLILAYAALTGILLALVFPPAGIVDGDAFHSDNPAGQWIAPLQDAAALALALGALFFLVRRRAVRFAAYCLAVCALALAAFGVYVAATMPGQAGRSAAATPAAAAADEAAAADLPPYHRRLFSFAAGRPNVLIFIFDMFHGGDVGRMLDGDPGMAERFPGFVWYRDTLSDGNNTLLSFPAVLGGPAYAPNAVNARTDGTLADRVVESMAEMPRRFLAAGYDVSSVNVRQNLAVHGGRTLSEMVGYSGDNLRDVTMPGVYAALTREAINPRGAGPGPESDRIRYLLSIALFRSVPNLLREGLVDLGLFDSDDIADKIYDEAAVPVLLPRFMTADSGMPTFKIFANTFAHNPYVLGPDSLVPLARNERLAVEKSGEAHFFTDRHIMRLMEKTIESLKEKGVYDNTRILFASDHDNKYDPHPYLAGKGGIFMYDAKPHSLLMFKDFGAGGPLRVSDRPMQGHDIPGLACLGLPAEADPPAPPPDGEGRVRRHVAGRPNLFHHSEKSFINLTTFSISGNMFDGDNWREIEYTEAR